jgi:hypothetical protein
MQIVRYIFPDTISIKPMMNPRLTVTVALVARPLRLPGQTPEHLEPFEKSVPFSLSIAKAATTRS